MVVGEHRRPAARPRIGGTGGYALGEWATSNASPGRSSSRRAATTSRPAPTSPSPLLFDPLVDAWLLINTRQNGGKPRQKMRVLVLTDYYPLKLLLGQMSVLIRQDSASIAAANFLAANELGLTELNLVRGVTEKNSIKEVQKMGEFISSCNCIACGKGQRLQRSCDTLGNPFIHLYEAKR